jgi:hypothetical protein
MNTYLYKAMRKYGFENFTIEMLEQTIQLDEQERYWISFLNPEYNMTAGGEGGDTSSSPNFIESMKKYHQRKTRDSYATYGMLGKTCCNRGKSLVKNRCPVMCEGVEYASVGEAEKHYPGINLRKRLDNPKYSEFYRLRERTRRK